MLTRKGNLPQRETSRTLATAAGPLQLLPYPSCEKEIGYNCRTLRPRAQLPNVDIAGIIAQSFQGSSVGLMPDCAALQPTPPTCQNRNSDFFTVAICSLL